LWDLVKKYWDLVSGFIVGMALSFMAHSDSDKVRLIYSIIILLLACMGLFRFIRQALERGKKKREEARDRNLLDGMVDAQIAVRVINLAQEPTKEGEKYGRLFISLWEDTKDIMKKFKVYFDKYKGYLLTIVLGLLTAIETCGGYINQLCGGVLMVGNIAVVPLVTLILTIVVGILSNGFTKEQYEKVKALFSKASTKELVFIEIKKSLKETTEKHKQYNKILATKEVELANLQSELESLMNTYNAKKEMYVMIPQLATEEDVHLAANAVSECKVKISAKEAEIEDTKATITNLATTIGALKSQL
jgi:hypothetical protein